MWTLGLLAALGPKRHPAVLLAITLRSTARMRTGSRCRCPSTTQKPWGNEAPSRVCCLICARITATHEHVCLAYTPQRQMQLRRSHSSSRGRRLRTNWFPNLWAVAWKPFRRFVIDLAALLLILLVVFLFVVLLLRVNDTARVQPQIQRNPPS